jgi:DNA helicase-2/ATP-dependent DNA helicase PcrA
MPCLTDGALPIVYAQTPQALEEERRLLYVGLTRARELLYLSWSLAREPGGRWARQPSPFLDDLRPRTGERGAEKKRPSRGRSSRSGADR